MLLVNEIDLAGNKDARIVGMIEQRVIRLREESCSGKCECKNQPQKRFLECFPLHFPVIKCGMKSRILIVEDEKTALYALTSLPGDAGFSESLNRRQRSR